MRHIVRVITMAMLAVLLGICLSGCDGKPQDVAADPAYGDFSKILGVWRTKVPMRLVELGNEKVLYILAGPQVTVETPVAAVPVNTQIRIEHLVFKPTFETNYLNVTGTLVGGPNSGKCIVLDDMFPPDLLQHYELAEPGKSWGPNKPWTVSHDKIER
jgi:hypothetical protein